MSVFRSILALLVLGLASPVLAEPIGFFQLSDTRYNPSVPAPEDRFGFGVGERPVRHDQMVSYLTEIAQGSDRITVETIGYTHEHRPILFFVVTSPENQSRIEDIRAAHLAQLDPAAAAGNGPAIVWLNYGVHGAEPSGMDAAIPMLYHLAAAEGAEIEQTLRDSVVLITAVFNPDGHNRRASLVEMFGSDIAVTDPAHAQHNWPSARTNHYWFDLNRQWLLQTQPESQAWLTQWHHWKPQVSADFHEMGTDATFYFHPGEPRRLNPLIPGRARELTRNIAQHHIGFLDQEARLYTTEEGFDNFYVGKGSTYPQVNGSLGILFEIGSARGGLIESNHGLVSHGDNVRTQFRTGLTTIAGALAQRREIAAYQRQFFADAAASAGRDRTRGYVFSAEGDPARLNLFLDLLDRHDVTVHALARDLRADGRTYRAGEAYIVPMQQRQYVMIRALFDRVTSFEENVFYDVSGWTLPLAYDLEYSALTGNLSAQSLGEVARPGNIAFSAPPVSSYGYVLRWSDYYAPRALYRLLDADIRVRIATETAMIMTHEGLIEFGPGTAFIPLVGQDVSAADIHDLAGRIAAEDGVPVYSATTGSTPGDTPDLGDRNGFRPVERPEILLLFDDGISLYDAGEVWHQLDHRMQIPVTLRRKSELAGLDWSRYTHLVVVGGNNTGFAGADLERIRDWIRDDGGVLIASRQAAQMAQRAFFDLDEDADDAAAETGEPVRRDYAAMPVDDAEHVIGGAIFAGDLDTSHPIGFGYSDRFIAVHRNTEFVLDRPEDDPFAVVVEYAADPLLSGYASQRRRDEIAGTPAVIAQRLGRGSVVMFADNPNFRATFRGPEKMFLNAVFFGGLINRPRGDY